MSDATIPVMTKRQPMNSYNNMTAKHKRTTTKHKAHARLTTPAGIVLESVRNGKEWSELVPH